MKRSRVTPALSYKDPPFLLVLFRVHHLFLAVSPAPGHTRSGSAPQIWQVTADRTHSPGLWISLRPTRPFNRSVSRRIPATATVPTSPMKARIRAAVYRLSSVLSTVPRLPPAPAPCLRFTAA